MTDDYKIISEVIANHIKDVLPTIINDSQIGLVKGRYKIFELHCIIEIIEDANENDNSGIIFFADFEKYFDSLNRKFMYKCLEHFNFGPSFINWIK